MKTGKRMAFNWCQWITLLVAIVVCLSLQVRPDIYIYTVDIFIVLPQGFHCFPCIRFVEGIGLDLRELTYMTYHMLQVYLCLCCCY